jgi:isopenicillin-N epimerase
VVEVDIPLPIADERAIARAVAAKLGIRTKLAIFDHIASHSSLVLPAAELVQLGHEAGAKVMIDGAHAPGMIALDVPAVGADWYVGNLHKWYFAPRCCGVLWASPAMQALTHPLAISHGYGAGFRTEFAWTGTRDVTPALAAPAAIAFHRDLGGEALMTRNTTLARDAAAMLAQRWRTELTGPLACFAAMATVRLPIADEPSGTRANALMRELSERHGIAAAVFALGDALWVRVAAQAYNEMADYERLAALFAPPFLRMGP